MEEDIRKKVREGYAKVAGGCGCGCCGVSEDVSERIGYSADELKSVPDGANMGLGCGNPTALASLKKGEAVLDLGSGAGFDCFLAAAKVGKKGRVIGVDMTSEMLEKARENVAKGGYENVEFRLGEIENLPVADSSVDVVISNCVINLSPDKQRVFSEVFRVLRPGGRLMVSDIVLEKELPEKVRKSVAAYVGCISGAMLKEDYLQVIIDSGFSDVRVVEESFFPLDCIANDPTADAVRSDLELSAEELRELNGAVLSVKVAAKKRKCCCETC